MKTNFLHFVTTQLSQWWSKDSTVSESITNLSFSYIVKYSGNANSSDSLPMLIALHGDGDTVNSFYQTALDKFNTEVRIVLVTAPILHDMGNVWPYSADQFTKYGKIFSQFIDTLAINYPTVNKPILLGFSGGGTMAYYQAVMHGDCYSYIFPISGLLFKEQLGWKFSNPSAEVYAYHGKADEVVSFAAGIKAFNLLKQKGVKVSFTEFESGHHGLFAEMKLEITQAVEKKLDPI
ncbi:MAG: alpha/beta hydrolase [Methylococcaceae bacterium]